MYQMLTKFGDFIGLSSDPSVRNGVALLVTIALYTIFILREKKPDHRRRGRFTSL